MPAARRTFTRRAPIAPLWKQTRRQAHARADGSMATMCYRRSGSGAFSGPHGALREHAAPLVSQITLAHTLITAAMRGQHTVVKALCVASAPSIDTQRAALFAGAFHGHLPIVQCMYHVLMARGEFCMEDADVCVALASQSNHHDICIWLMTRSAQEMTEAVC